MRGLWGFAILTLSLIFALLSTLSTRDDYTYELVNGVALSGGRLELVRFLREPHRFPVVAATTGFPEMAPALQARWDSALHQYVTDLTAQNAQVAELPSLQGDTEKWLAELRKESVTHIALYRDLPESSPRNEREQAVAKAIESMPEKFNLIWDGRFVEVYEIAR